MDNKNSFPNFDDFFSDRQNRNKQGNNGNRQTPFLFYVFVALIITLLLNSFVIPAIKQARIESSTYSDFQQAVENKEVKAVELGENSIKYEVEKDGKTTIYSTTRIKNEFTEAQILSELTEQGVKYNETLPVENNFLLNFIFSWVIPLLLFMAVGSWLSKRMTSAMGNMGGGGFGLGGFGKSNAREYEKKDDSIRFREKNFLRKWWIISTIRINIRRLVRRFQKEPFW